MTDDLLPRYYELLNNAQSASDEEDLFDLVSGNAESERIYRILVQASTQAQVELVTYVAAHGAELLAAWRVPE